MRKTRISRAAALLVAVFMLLGNIPLFTASAADSGVPYVDAEGNPATANGVTELSSSTTSLSDGWYVAKGYVTIGKRLNLEKSVNVNLILADGCNLTLQGGISGDGEVTIWGQSAQTGQLYAIGDKGNNQYKGFAGISSNVTINGGNITAIGTTGGAGIGGNYAGGNKKIITINGGNVTAIGSDGGAGIGGGYSAGAGTITITGGNVKAVGAGGSAGIGGGYSNNGGSITISGGNITATGSDGAAGIGGGKSNHSGDIKISGGTVSATGGKNGSGIGGGDGANLKLGSITVSGGIVSATGGGSRGYAFGILPSFEGDDGSEYCHITYSGSNSKEVEWTGNPLTAAQWRYIIKADICPMTVNVEVSASSSKVAVNGENEQTVEMTAKCTATASTPTQKDKEVTSQVVGDLTWKVEGNNSKNTVIDADSGILTVGGDETAEKLTVTATDGTFSDSAEINIIIDNTAPVLSGFEPPEVGVTSTYCLSKMVQFTEKNLNKDEAVTIDGIPVKLTKQGSSDAYTFTVEGKGSHEVVISDLAGNSISFTINILGEHKLTYSINQSLPERIEERCANEGCHYLQRVKLLINGAKRFFYTGEPIEADVRLSYDTGWQGPRNVPIVYENNVEPGKATATLTVNGATARVTYTIEYNSPLNVTVSGTEGENDWYTSDVTLTPPDGCFLSLDGKNWSPTLVVNRDGINEVTYYAKNKVGSVSKPVTLEIRIDKTAPNISADSTFKDGGIYCKTVSCEIVEDNLDRITVDEEEISATQTDFGYSFTVDTPGEHTVTAYDKAGNTLTAHITVNADHTLGEPVFIWSEDGKSATAEFTCQNDNNHIIKVEAQVSEKPTDPDTPTDGTVTYTATVTINGKTYTSEKTVTGEPTDLFEVSGSINIPGGDTSAVTVTIRSEDAADNVYNDTVDSEFSVKLAPGKYIAVFAAENCAERTYDLTVEDGNVILDADLHLFGDVNGDGFITTVDVGLANSAAQGVKKLSDYDKLVADVTGDGITTADVGKINAHAKGTEYLW